MKIQYYSDLHLEFRENKEFLKAKPLYPNGDILLLAGDIVPFAVMGKHCDFFDYVSDNFKEVYWVPGNHEYYHSDIADKEASFHEKIKTNMHLLNNKQIALNGVNIIFSTLWSNISPQSEWKMKQSISDFSLIKINGNKLTPAAFNILHQQCLTFLKQAIQNIGNTPTVIVTHHVPTFLNYPEQYKNNPLNEAFVVELHDIILNSSANYWIYGHHHSNAPSFTIGKTQLLTNQLGYVQYNEHEAFKLYAIIELPSSLGNIPKD